jgi:dTDP-4-dehydrorhamnose reductase
MARALPGASVLIAGASGQIGHHLALAAERRGLTWSGTYNEHFLPGLHALDLRDAAAVARIVRLTAPTYVLVPAAASSADRVEREESASYGVNVLGIGNLVDAANEVDATIVYFSSDYIFDGADGPYGELAPACPISRYGMQKLIAEHLILQRAEKAMIVRTTIVYGWEPQGKNFIYRLLAALRTGEEIAVPADQIGTPTYAPVLADAVYDLLATDIHGVINIAGRQLAKRDEFARAAARAFGEDPDLIKPVLTSELGQAAPRPLRAGLCADVAEELLGRELPGYEEGLRRMQLAREPATLQGSNVGKN